MEFAERPTRMAYVCRYQGLGHVLNLDFPPFEIIEESARAPAVVTDRPRVIALAGQHGLERGDQLFIGFQHHRPPLLVKRPQRLPKNNAEQSPYRIRGISRCSRAEP